jgi:predicted nucleic acid-binding protein
MKIVIDTNVILSGIFWKGPPEKILRLWDKMKTD